MKCVSAPLHLFFLCRSLVVRSFPSFFFPFFAVSLLTFKFSWTSFSGAHDIAIKSQNWCNKSSYFFRTLNIWNAWYPTLYQASRGSLFFGPEIPFLRHLAHPGIYPSACSTSADCEICFVWLWNSHLDRVYVCSHGKKLRLVKRWSAERKKRKREQHS